MPKLKPGTILPTEEEERQINAGIAADPDNPEWTDEDFKRARPAAEVLPDLLGKEAAEAVMKKRGRPAGTATKELVSLRIDKEVLDAFRASGEGWQTRMNDVLRQWAAEHPV
jgi:uncharacterized protein (DUF4415 family)